MDRSTTFAHGRWPYRLALVLPLLALAACETTPLGPGPPPVPLSAVTIAPTADTLQVGETVQFTATAFDTLGAVVAGVGFTWSSSNTDVFTVSSSGRVTGRGEGIAQLVVEAGGRADSATVFVYPDTGWFAQTSNANGANLNGVFFLPDGRTGWAVGEGGKIVRTTDTGETWSVQTSTTSLDLHGVWFTTATEGWAVGLGGTVVRTTNAGTNWTRLTAPGLVSSDGLRDVWFASRDTGWAVGYTGVAGVVVRTVNRGASWTRSTLPTQYALNSVSFAGTNDGWVVGDNGFIAGTHDRGQSWYPILPTLTTNHLRAVWRRSEPVAHAVGNIGVAPRTVTGPDSTEWELRNAGSLNSLEGVAFVSDLEGFAVGFNTGGTVLHTTDGGLTWQVQVSHSSVRLNDVWFVDSERGWAVGDNGTIIHTARGGSSQAMP